MAYDTTDAPGHAPGASALAAPGCYDGGLPDLPADWKAAPVEPLLMQCAIERWNGLTGTWAVVVGERLAGRAVEALLPGTGREVTEVGLGTFMVEIEQAEADELNDRGQLVRANAYYRLTAELP